MSIGKRVREARQKRGWTQEELAKRAGVVHGTIRSVENGSRAPRGKTLRAINEAFESENEMFVRSENGAFQCGNEPAHAAMPAQESWDRLTLLLIAQPRTGWEDIYEEITRREIERLAPKSEKKNKNAS